MDARRLSARPFGPTPGTTARTPLSRRSFLLGALAASEQPQILEVNRIWGQQKHNAFTDLLRFRERWYCVCREGSAHVSKDGWIRVLTSADGTVWQSASSVWSPDADLRDPKLCVRHDGRLMLTAAAAFHEGSPVRHRTWAWYSLDGREWGQPRDIGDANIWLWRVAWHRGVAYSVGYSTVEPRFTRLYASRDGVNFQTHVENLFDRDYPNESSILFLPDESALCLLRRDAGTMSAQLGRSRPPYKGWQWQDLKIRIGGPNMIQLPDDRIVAAGRFYEGGAHMALAWLDLAENTMTEFLRLPSGGDCSYPGLALHHGILWISYYSSHEGKASIYLAKVRIPDNFKSEPERPRSGLKL
jgi:hypothetical protein